MAVARDHLRRDVLAAQPDEVQHELLELRAIGGIRANRSGQRADGRLVEGLLQACQVPVRLEGEAGELEAERGRLGVHAMGAADGDRVAVLERLCLQRVAEGARTRYDDPACLADLK